MTRYIARRLVLLAFTLFLVSLAVFYVIELLPGDTATIILGQNATPENIEVMREQLGLDRPSIVRYGEWAGGMVRGDWGESQRLNLPVGPILGQRLRNSLGLALLTFIIGVPSGIALGTLAGLFRDRLPDRLISIGTLFAVSLPEFATGVLMIYLFASTLGWLPPSSLMEEDASLLASIRLLLLPALTMVLVMWAHITRMTRSSMAEVMDSEYVRTAVLKGLSQPKVVWRHALRNALLPTISVVAMNIGWLFGGLIVVENVFAYPGVGRLLLTGIRNQDIPVLLATTMVIAGIYMVSNLAADLLYRFFNPKIRLT